MTLKEFVEENLTRLEELKRIALVYARAKLSRIRPSDHPGPKSFRMVVLEPLSSMDFGSMLIEGDMRTFFMLAEDLLSEDPDLSSELERLCALRAMFEQKFSGDDGSDDWDCPEPFDPSQCG